MLNKYKSTLGNYLLGAVLLFGFGALVLNVHTHPTYLVLVYALAVGLLFPIAKGNAFKIPTKWAQAVEHYVLGLIVTGGFGSVILAFQAHAHWKDLLLTFIAALVLPLLKSTGLVSFLVSLATKKTGLPSSVVTPLVDTAVKDATKVVEQATSTPAVIPAPTVVTPTVTVTGPATVTPPAVGANPPLVTQ